MTVKVPKLPRSVVTHYAALAKAEQVAIEIKVEGASFRITPFDAQEEARAGYGKAYGRAEIELDL